MVNEWFSSLPEAWEVCRLDQVATVIDSLHETPVYSDAGRPMVRVTDVQRGFLNLSKALRVTEDVFLKFTQRYTPKLGDIVFSRVGSYGNASYVNTDEPFCLGQNTAVLSPRINGRFLHMFLQSAAARQQIEQAAVGSTQKTISLKSIGALQIPIPPAGELEAIAYILGMLDDKIELNRQMNETLEEMARALFKSWFVDFDPVRAKAEGRDPGLPKHLADLFPDSFEDSELGEIPKGWGVGSVESLCTSITSGGTPARSNPFFWKGGKIPWFKTGELLDGPLLESEEYITEAALAESSCKLWPAGTILFALYASPTVGRLGVLTYPGTSNQAAAGLIARPKYGIPFVRRLLLEARPKLQSIAVGAAQQNINQGTLKAHKVLVPYENVADAYSRLISPLDERQITLSTEVGTLTKLRDILLPKLISGELRVKDAERFASAAV